MSDKMMFVNTLAEFDLGITASCVMTECEIFGMTWGCRKDCPTYIKEGCELQEENKKQFTKWNEES